MDRRSFLMLLGAGAAVAAAAPAQAFTPSAFTPPLPDRAPAAVAPEHALATPDDLAHAKAEKTYWVWRRPHRRHYWRRRYRRCRYFVWRGRLWRRCWG